MKSGVDGSYNTNATWLDFIGPLLDHNAEVRLVEQLVDDIYQRLGKDFVSNVRQVHSGDSPATQNSATSSTNTPSASSQSTRLTAKRRRKDDSEPGDRSDDDEPYKDDKAKRRKKNADQLSRYLICTEFAASQDPAGPKCFFGAWPSVDRLKQDHLVKVHKIDSALLKVDKGGTESEKWWRLFDKLHPGFREENPNTFIPGPLWEDRIAHNAYNKILSEAMKEAERIRQRGAQALASQLQDLLDRQLSVERQELRQMVSDLISSKNRNMNTIDPLTSEPEIERQPQSVQYDTHNGMMTPLQQQSDAGASTHPPTPSQFTAPFSFPPPVPPFSSNGPSLDNYRPSLNDHTSSRYPTEDSFSTGTHPTSINPSPTPTPLQTLVSQMNLPPLTAPAISTQAPSETMYESSHLTGLSSNLPHDNANMPFGKACRCRSHSKECTRSSMDQGTEWCVGCSGWFVWSKMAEPFFWH